MHWFLGLCECVKSICWNSTRTVGGVALDTSALVHAAVVTIKVRTVIQGGLVAEALHVIVGERGGHESVKGREVDLSGSSVETQLLADNVTLELNNQSFFKKWSSWVYLILGIVI